jgi:hypothetical protein
MAQWKIRKKYTGAEEVEDIYVLKFHTMVRFPKMNPIERYHVIDGKLEPI